MYGYQCKPVSFNSEPLDALINYIDSNYLDWNVSSDKFIKVFKLFYPKFDYAEHDIPIFLVNELEIAIEKDYQSTELLDKLIKLTLQTR